MHNYAITFSGKYLIHVRRTQISHQLAPLDDRASAYMRADHLHFIAGITRTNPRPRGINPYLFYTSYFIAIEYSSSLNWNCGKWRYFVT